VDGGGLDGVGDVGLELLEVGLEAGGELARGLVVGLLVSAGTSGQALGIARPKVGWVAVATSASLPSSAARTRVRV
jgi:hypothetical protein